MMMCTAAVSYIHTWDVDVRDTNCPRENGAGDWTTKPFTVATRQRTRRAYTWFIMVCISPSHSRAAKCGQSWARVNPHEGGTL